MDVFIEVASASGFYVAKLDEDGNVSEEVSNPADAIHFVDAAEAEIANQPAPFTTLGDIVCFDGDGRKFRLVQEGTMEEKEREAVRRLQFCEQQSAEGSEERKTAQSLLSHLMHARSTHWEWLEQDIFPAVDALTGSDGDEDKLTG